MRARRRTKGCRTTMGCGGSTPAAADATKVADGEYVLGKLPLGPVFKQFDASGDGFLQIDELKRAFRAIGLKKRDGEKFQLDEKTFDAFDTNKDGKVSLAARGGPCD